MRERTTIQIPACVFCGCPESGRDLVWGHMCETVSFRGWPRWMVDVYVETYGLGR